MAQKTPLLSSLLVGAGLLAVTNSTSHAFNPFICCRSGPTVAEAIEQVPPLRAGLARVWFLRQFRADRIDGHTDDFGKRRSDVDKPARDCLHP